MSEKFEDLFPTIRDDETLEFTRAELNGVRFALQWLDENRSLTTKKTITESELSDAARSISTSPEQARFRGEYFRKALDYLGIPVVDDPEPTNAEKLEAALRRCNYAGGPEHIAQQLDELGVTAP